MISLAVIITSIKPFRNAQKYLFPKRNTFVYGVLFQRIRFNRGPKRRSMFTIARFLPLHACSYFVRIKHLLKTCKIHSVFVEYKQINLHFKELYIKLSNIKSCHRSSQFYFGKFIKFVQRFIQHLVPSNRIEFDTKAARKFYSYRNSNLRLMERTAKIGKPQAKTFHPRFSNSLWIF